MTDFLDALWGSLRGDAWGYIWSGQDKRSHWFNWPAELSQATLQAEQLASPDQGPAKDVYFSVGLGPRQLSAGQRTNAADVTAIAGIWVDIDYKSDQHKKQNLPPTIDEAIKLAVDMPVPPTAIISTGHGIAAWWLFKEPWEFDLGSADGGAAERNEAAWMVAQWQQGVRARAAEQGWDVDSTHDLSRVMRIPGTRNFKDPNAIKDVELLEDYFETRRYARTDLELYMMDTTPTLRGEVIPAELPQDWKPGPIQATDQFTAIMAEDERFRQSWEHQRPDFQDQSLSTYDLSLASLAANAGWTDGQIADLLAEHRRKSGDLTKGTRKDYLARTIAVARRKSDTVASVDALERGDATALTSGDNSDKAREMWARRGVQNVIAWYKVLGDPIEFVLVTPGGELRMSEEVFSTYTAAQRRIVANLGLVLKGVKNQPEWWQVAAALVRVAEVRGEAADPVEQVRAWLEGYITQNGIEETAIEYRRERLESGPIRISDPRTGGIVAIRGPLLLRHLQGGEAEDRMTISELKRLWLRAGGSTNGQIHCLAANGNPTNLRAWTIPESREP